MLLVFARTSRNGCFPAFGSALEGVCKFLVGEVDGVGCFFKFLSEPPLDKLFFDALLPVVWNEQIAN